jgi:hypothetical protein
VDILLYEFEDEHEDEHENEDEDDPPYHLQSVSSVCLISKGNKQN